MRTLFEDSVRWEAKRALNEQLDTLVSADELEITLPRLWPLRHFCYVTCEAFDDCCVRVPLYRFGEMNGAPKRGIVYIE